MGLFTSTSPASMDWIVALIINNTYLSERKRLPVDPARVTASSDEMMQAGPQVSVSP